MSLEAQRRALENGRAEIIQIAASGQLLTAEAVLARWRDEASFRTFFIAALMANDYPGFFWEMPPLSPQSAGNRFECVAIRDDSLSMMRADESDFAEYLNEGSEPVAAFASPPVPC